MEVMFFSIGPSLLPITVLTCQIKQHCVIFCSYLPIKTHTPGYVKELELSPVMNSNGDIYTSLQLMLQLFLGIKI